MRWKRKERQAIEAQIKEYEKKIINPLFLHTCILCVKFDSCYQCPNNIICELLNLNWFLQLPCKRNKEYFIEKFRLSKVMDWNKFVRNMQQLKFRRQMWGDALQLTKRDFVKKYKREG